MSEPNDIFRIFHLTDDEMLLESKVKLNLFIGDKLLFVAFDLPQTGLCDVAQQVRDYIKSVFGASSYEYHHITKIHFRRHPL